MLQQKLEPVSYFQRIYDVAVYGSGYGAFAAAMQLQRSGRRVILVNRLPDVLWESGHAFGMETGRLDAPPWKDLIDNLTRRKAVSDDGRLDGAIAEVIGCSLIRQANLPALFYVTPLAVQGSGSALEAVVFGTKAGLRRLVARQWIDASETGELVSLIQRDDSTVRRPDSLIWRAMFQHDRWLDTADRDLAASAGASSLRWETGIWPGERYLTLTLPGDSPRPRQGIVPALQALRNAMPDVMANSVLSHCSLDPLPVYGATPDQIIPVAASNLVCAAPARVAAPVRTLADRFALGLSAVERLDEYAVHEPDPSRLSQAIDNVRIDPIETIESDVIVAGAGTGGAIAAIAAGRAGAKVTIIDPLGFPGGIGTGGGIHYYWYGIPGGLQEELDQRVIDLMGLFGTKAQVMGFHPDAKKLVLEQMLDEAGARFVPHTMLCSIGRTGRRVTRALAGNGRGPLELRSNHWIDSTGDGDLCAMAGASFTLGRDSDGTLHAYSQSSGRLQPREPGKPVRMNVVNYDAGWVDPTDSQDLSRGRIVGVSQYLCDPWTPTYAPDDRPTYIAPAIGLRQARQVHTDYLLTLADLIERRTFPDVIGFTGAHYDNHSVDYEFESDEGVFWVWVCRQWRAGRTACQMPYRMILPRDLDNVWLACRAIGVTPDAHYSCRMQRDMQRFGEVAGNAAALAAKHGTNARGVPMDQLQQALAKTGAVKPNLVEPDYDFGPQPESNAFDHATHEAAVRQGLEDLRAGKPGMSIWYVYRAGSAVRDEVVKCLDSGNAMSSWLAAGILATAGDRRAEPRLLQAIASREFGFDDVPEGERPGPNRYMVPHWLAAVTLLRACGTGACLPTLQKLAMADAVPLNIRTAVAITLTRLVERLEGGLDTAQAEQILNALLTDPVPGTVVHPQRPVAQTLNGPFDFGIQPTAEDHRWQLDLVVAKARLALGLEPQETVANYAHDERIFVRRAFAALNDAAQVVLSPET